MASIEALSRAPIRRRALLSTALAGLLLASGCSNSGATLGVTPVPMSGMPISFSHDVQPILTQNCAVSSCHASPLGAPVSLDAASAYQELVGVRACEASGLHRVQAGSSALSYLVHKVDGDLSTIQSSGGCTGCNGFTPSGDCGSQMPPGGLPLLSTAEIQVLRDWIDQGAQNN